MRSTGVQTLHRSRRATWHGTKKITRTAIRVRRTRRHTYREHWSRERGILERLLDSEQE